jgi:hypothetical protein
MENAIRQLNYFFKKLIIIDRTGIVDSYILSAVISLKWVFHLLLPS